MIQIPYLNSLKTFGNSLLKVNFFVQISFLVAALISFNYSIGQNPYSEMELIDAFEDYAELEREVVFVHINKSTFVKGETIGLKAYVFDKKTREFSIETSNLYFAILDSSGKTLTDKMVMVNYGTAVAEIEIDNTFKTGDYEIRAYTNWMKNFEEQNLFTAKIRVLNPDFEESLKSVSVSKSFDIQALPEGGQMLADVLNTIGIIVKNEKGLGNFNGAENLEGEVVDANGTSLTKFKLNQFGIGRFSLKPTLGQTYTIKMMIGDKQYQKIIENLKPKGVSISLSAIKDGVALKISTNKETLPELSNRFFKILIHNGDSAKETAIKLNNDLSLTQVIKNDDLFSGINIFTIFDQNNNPLLERQYFNYEGIDLRVSEAPLVNLKNDSINVTLNYKNIDLKSLNHFSVSVLPSKTKSYNHHHNLASYVLLQPYVKGYIEQADYYFTDITERKKYDLDNLLLTQGWSSYDWDTIFTDPPDYDFDFENGISFTVNSKITSSKTFLIYPSLNNASELVTLNHENPSFMRSGLFPIDNETVNIGELSPSGKVRKPSIYLQFEPTKIPTVQSNLSGLSTNSISNDSQEMVSGITSEIENIEELDEVIVTNKKEYTEIEKLNNRSIGKVEYIDETLIRRHRTLLRYLRERGFQVDELNTSRSPQLVIRNNFVSSFRPRFVEDERIPFSNGNLTVGELQEASSIPLIYLNGMVLQNNLNMLRDLTMEDIEYIEINKSGVGAGMRAGGAGLIRIKTRPDRKLNDIDTSPSYESYEIPLKFTVAKKFYIPEYMSYTNDFFNKYGVIDWFPNLFLDESGKLEVSIPNKDYTEINLYVEGALNDGTFISEVKTIPLK